SSGKNRRNSPRPLSCPLGSSKGAISSNEAGLPDPSWASCSPKPTTCSSTARTAAARRPSPGSTPIPRISKRRAAPKPRPPDGSVMLDDAFPVDSTATLVPWFPVVMKLSTLRHSLVLAACLFAQFAVGEEPEMIWYDVSTWGVEGQGWSETEFKSRY